MQDEGGVDRRFRPALSLVTQEVEVLLLADGATYCSTKLVETQSIETRSRKQVLGIEVVVAEEFVDRAMHVIGARLGDGVYHRAKVAPIVRRVRTGRHAKLLHPVLRGANALHSGDARGVIGAVKGEERSVALAHATETKFQYCFGKGRLRAHGCAPAHIHGGSEQDEVYEVAPGNGQVFDLGSINHLADVRFFGVDALDDVLHLYLFLDRDTDRDHQGRG